jgi:hypothetical protein
MVAVNFPAHQQLDIPMNLFAKLLLQAAAIILLSTNIVTAQTSDILEAMPADLEMRFALSALPANLRADASVYLLEPAKGYKLVHRGRSKLECLVERTVWEWADYRNDIYIPLCYDVNGVEHHLKVIRDAAQLRASGLSATALKNEIERRYQKGVYTGPQKSGLSYMVGPVMRAKGPPDMQVHTMAMPHLMFYAPYILNEDIGAKPDLQQPESLRMPFIDTQGLAQQSYMIQLLGETEKAHILASEKTLITALCSYRDLLCLTEHQH